MKKLIKDKTNAGFFQVPDYKNFVISRMGSVIHVPTDTLLTRSFDEETQSYNIDTSDYNVVLPPVHHMLGQVFVEEPVLIKKLKAHYKNVVFRDGNSKNIYLDNLKWELNDSGKKYIKNIACGVNLKNEDVHKNVFSEITVNTPMMTKNVLTGEIAKYNTLADLSMEFGVAVNTLIKYLTTSPVYNKNLVKTLNGCYFKMSESDNWPIITDKTLITDFKLTANGRVKKCVKVKFKNGVEAIYDSLKTTATAVGRSKTAVGFALQKSKGRPVLLTTGDIVEYYDAH